MGRANAPLSFRQSNHYTLLMQQTQLQGEEYAVNEGYGGFIGHEHVRGGLGRRGAEPDQFDCRTPVPQRLRQKRTVDGKLAATKTNTRRRAERAMVIGSSRDDEVELVGETLAESMICRGMVGMMQLDPTQAA